MITHLISVSPARMRCLSVGSPVVITERTRCEGQGGQEETHCWWGTGGWAHMKNILFISTQTAKAYLLWLSNWLTTMCTVPLFSVTVVKQKLAVGAWSQRLLKELSPSSQWYTLQSWKGTKKNYTNKIVYNILRWNNFSKQWMCVCVYSNRHTHSHMCITIQESS